MVFSITLDANGKELFRNPLPKGKRPRCGFWRAVDGNFYKRLNDPRCITDEEARQIHLKRIEEEFVEKYGAVEITRVRFGLDKTKVFRSPVRISPEEIQMKAGNFILGINDSNITLGSVAFPSKPDIPGLERRSRYARILLNTKEKCISIWDTNTTKVCPDIVILEALK